LFIDVFSCYATGGAGALLGLGLITLIRTDQPRIAQALRLYRWAFACLAALLSIELGPQAYRADLVKFAIAMAACGVSLLAWAFRQLNGRRTPPWVGASVSVLAGLTLAAAAVFASPQAYVLTMSTVFALISCALALDQGWLILRSGRVRASEFSLLVAAATFAAIWLFTLAHAVSEPGPYPPHWLHQPDWLQPGAALSFALMPLAVAAVVFAIVNERLGQQLRARALSDDLTGALSRRGLRELGERMLALKAHQPTLVAVLMIDVDHFKLVNDHHGHLTGDDVLKHLTQVMREQLRDDALLARYGGEEFSVLLPVRSQQEARVVAERLRLSIASRPCKARVGNIPITVSIGVSFHTDNSSLEEDLARADARLYLAKQSGRNRVVSSDPTV
jgi:diguanylate cyclase (GGDEF)-like protein